MTKAEKKNHGLIVVIVGLAIALVGCVTNTRVVDDVAPTEPIGPPAQPTVQPAQPTTVPVVPAKPVVATPESSGVEPDDDTVGEPTFEAVDEVNIYCSGSDVHPVGESLSETYDVTYDEVMRLFCSGFTFDNILLAFETSQQSDYSPRELLYLKQTMSWDEIWAEVGFVNN